MCVCERESACIKGKHIVVYVNPQERDTNSYVNDHCLKTGVVEEFRLLQYE